MAMILAVFHGLMMSPIDIMKQKHPSNDKYRGIAFSSFFWTPLFQFLTIVGHSIQPFLSSLPCTSSPTV